MLEKKNKQKKRIIIYARISREGRSKDGVNIESQLDSLKVKLHDRADEIIDIVQELKTASDKDSVFDIEDYVKLRPEFYNRVYLRAVNHEFDELWVFKFDRFARSDMAPILHRLFETKFKVKVISLSEGVDPLTRDIHQVIATDEIRRLKQRLNPVLKQNFLKHRKAQQKPPFGYKKGEKPGVFLVSEVHARIIKEVFDYFLVVKSVSDTFQKFSKHYPYVSTLRRQLRNKFYAGFVSRTITGKDGIKEKMWLEGKHVPLISLEKFNKIQRILDKKTKKRIVPKYLKNVIS